MSGRPESRDRDGEVVALDLDRRPPRGPAGPLPAAPSQPSRCGHVDAEQRPCRDEAGPSGYCALHSPAEQREQEPEAWAEHATPPSREEWEEAVASVLAFVRRRLVGDYEVDEFGFDRDLTEQVLMPLARPLYQRYWRVRAVGIERVPAEAGALVVANHSGTVPFDAVMTKVALLDEHPAHRHLRLLAADLALSLPVIGPLARKSGNTLAHEEDAARLLAAGELVGVWPEGFKGIGKHYRDRYKLQRFGRGGFVEVALRAGVPIVPVAIVGAEETYPIIANVKWLARLLGLPYFPLTWQFPWLGPLGLVPLPSKWLIEFGEPIDTASYGPDACEDPMTVLELSDQVRDQIQQMLYRNLLARRSVFLG